MTYGTHTALVQEILDFAEQGPLLRPAAPIEDGRFRVIHDFAEAMDHAYRRPISDDEDAPNWTDLREREASESLAATYRDASLSPVRAAVRQLLDRLTRAMSRLPAPYAEIADDVAADLRNCAFSRAVFGADDRFFDLVSDAYARGGWPCGWDGAYPEGTLVVFEPSPADR
jgi:hypothetical protein